jgi:hypothetical protein
MRTAQMIAEESHESIHIWDLSLSDDSNGESFSVTDMIGSSLGCRRPTPPHLEFGSSKALNVLAVTTYETRDD